MDILFLGKKLGMKQFFTEKGYACPVTIIKVLPRQFHEKKKNSTETPFSLKEKSSNILDEKHSVQKFFVGQKIIVSGKTSGKGFTGTIKRYNFSRGPMTHGSKNHRLVGSIGAGTSPGRVYPGKKMAGRVGYKKAISFSEIIRIEDETNTILLKGSLPGKKGTLLRINCI